MGYAVYEDRDARDSGVERWAGYGVPGVCDHPDCDERLVLGRGLGNKCERRYVNEGDDDERVETGCGLYFCARHLMHNCQLEHDDFTPKPDLAEWERWMLSDESWTQWRDENPTRVAAMRERVEKAGV